MKELKVSVEQVCRANFDQAVQEEGVNPEDSHLKRRMREKGLFEVSWRGRKHYTSRPVEECSTFVNSRGGNPVRMSVQRAHVPEKITPLTHKTTVRWMGNGRCGKYIIRIKFYKVRGVQMGNLQGVQIHTITIVDLMDGHEMLYVLDGFSRYNQIKIAQEDQHKIIFTWPWGTYYWNSMPFSLKNIGSTY